jgi:hypothetical protein
MAGTRLNAVGTLDVVSLHEGWGQGASATSEQVEGGRPNIGERRPPQRRAHLMPAKWPTRGLCREDATKCALELTQEVKEGRKLHGG